MFMIAKQDAETELHKQLTDKITAAMQCLTNIILYQ